MWALWEEFEYIREEDGCGFKTTQDEKEQELHNVRII
jgi:hypothetical protein